MEKKESFYVKYCNRNYCRCTVVCRSDFDSQSLEPFSEELIDRIIAFCKRIPESEGEAGKELCMRYGILPYCYRCQITFSRISGSLYAVRAEALLLNRIYKDRSVKNVTGFLYDSEADAPVPAEALSQILGMCGVRKEAIRCLRAVFFDKDRLRIDSENTEAVVDAPLFVMVYNACMKRKKIKALDIF